MSVFSEIMAIRKADKSKAYEMAVKAFVENPDDIWVRNAYGWTLYDQVKEKLTVSNEYMNVSTYINAYLDLDIERPSMTHSCFLVLFDKLLLDSSFPVHEILSRNNNFSENDWKKNDWNGKTYPGIAEKLIQHWAKWLMSNGDIGNVVSFLPVMEAALTKIEDNIWLYFYNAKLLLKIGKRDRAEEFLLPVIKQKRNDYWTWALLADIYMQNGTREKALSCYCKALTCSADEKFLVNTRLNFGKLLFILGKYDEAKTEISISLKTRFAEGIRLSEELDHIQQEKWFAEANLKADNKSFYLDNKNLAEEVLFSHLPWIDANLGGAYSRDNDKNTLFVKIFYNKVGSVQVLTIKQRPFNLLKKLKEGSAIRIKGELINERFQIYLLEVREVSTLWDCIIPQYGVIDHINESKSLVHYTISKTKQGVYKFSGKCPYNIGDYVELRLMESVVKDELITKVLSIVISDKFPSLICKAFKGTIRIKENQAYGFVEDVFIDLNLINKQYQEINNGMQMSGIAVINYNKPKQAWGWKAVRID